MTWKDLKNKLIYSNMKKEIRKLAVKDHPEMIEEIAIMNTEEICDVVAQDYEMLFTESDRIGLVKKENWEKCLGMIHFVER